MNDPVVRELYERTMMRCLACRRWVSVGPGQARVCPNCEAEGVASELAAVDMASHMRSLPARQDAPEDVAKLEAQLTKRDKK